jgi:hypothetical protein
MTSVQGNINEKCLYVANDQYQNEYLNLLIMTQTIKLDNQADAIKSLKDKNEKREEHGLYKMFIESIQDLNNNYKLEKTIPILFKLRSDRNDRSYFVNATLDASEIDKRICFFVDKLNNMTTQMKKKFEKQYPQLIDDLKKNIAFSNIQLTDDEEERLNDLWYEYFF